MTASEQSPSHAQERERARLRRKTLGIIRPQMHEQAQWAIALSGGGIRSATFCLGALQALAQSPAPLASSGVAPATTPPPPAKAPAPAAASPEPRDAVYIGTESPNAPPPRAASSTAAPLDSLIAQFDYLSTVSGGGYIGAFFTSLFVPGRLSGQDKDKAKAPEDPVVVTRRAYRALQDEPPARIHTDTRYDDAHPGRAALAWLRDNGRYLAPQGAGDLLYGMGVALRNWMATHYVIGTVILMVLAALLSLRLLLAWRVPAYGALEAQLHAAAVTKGQHIWWSPTWALCLAMAVVGMGPVGMAFWFSHPSLKKGVRRKEARSEHGDDPLAMKPLIFTRASFLGAVIAVILVAVGCAVGWTRPEQGQDLRWPLGLIVSACGGFVAWSVVIYGVSAWLMRKDSIAQQRVLLTRELAWSLKVMIVIALVATIDTLSQTLWLDWKAQTGLFSGAALAMLVWLLRTALPKLADRSTVAMVERLPLDLIAGVVGIVLWIVVASAFGMLLLQVVWFGHDPTQLAAYLLDKDKVLPLLHYALGSLGVSIVLALVVGLFPGFLNLSTFQSLYAARLTRAYLGATNHARFSPGTRAMHRDVAEPIKGDSLDTRAPYANPLAPVHFINVCVNQTMSPGEQLVQRDRKGKPMVIAPNGYYLDQDGHSLDAPGPRNELSYPLSFGEWIGVSGAAISTGLGRNTGLGFSLIVGFANLRLGRWWTGVKDPKKKYEQSLVRRIFQTQTYLIDEIRGLFYGSHRPYQYLSDGGHFDNTGIYELLKPERDRGVRLIALCDCGQDVDNDFHDLANLIRLARIDHGLEIRVNKEAARHELLSSHFGEPADFARRADGTLPPPSLRCAILLDVLSTHRGAGATSAAGDVIARIVLLKPVLTSDAPVDLTHYRSTHDGFPQQTTGDQFFDEAQWESYRQLGLHIGRRVFPQDPSSAYGKAFWEVCLKDLPA